MVLVRAVHHSAVAKKQEHVAAGVVKLTARNFADEMPQMGLAAVLFYASVGAISRETDSEREN